MILGSHVSCAGGLSQAIHRANELSCDCLQIFLSPPRAWPSEQKLIPFRSSSPGKKGSPRPAPASLEEDVSPFRESLSESGLCFAVAHACYLINLASPDPKLWERSVAALKVEWHRAEQLQLDGLVLHPGSHTTTTADIGLENVVRAVRRVQQDLQPEYCPLLLENTAGQGSCLGWKIQQLGFLIQELDSPTIGVCWDTCHAFAAGYDFRTAAGMKAMRNELEQFRLLDQIRVIHANDSFKECGSRVDRHEHIGLGCIGDAGWKRFVNALPFKKLPMILETEKGTDENGVDWDARNLDKLRSYLK
jgi:deoxyribonuclease IV